MGENILHSFMTLLCGFHFCKLNRSVGKVEKLDLPQEAVNRLEGALFSEAKATCQDFRFRGPGENV
jgi:hypothetical protein